jgi:hypothetical protein
MGFPGFELGLWRPGARRGDGSASGGTRRFRGVLLLAAALAVCSGSFVTPGAGAQEACETPFLVYTDPANPGVTTQTGDIAVNRDSVLLGDYRGDGRFAGYEIVGVQGGIINTATGMARVQGEFTATSPDGGSAIFVSYSGQVDFVGGTATGNFTVTGGTGNDAGYRASGTIFGTVVGPATLDGVDVGLC